MLRLVPIALFVAFATSVVANADPLTVTLQPHGPKPATPAEVVVVIRPVQETSGQLRKTMPFDGSADFDLAPGHWSVDVESESWWHPTQFVTTRGRNNAVIVPLWRSGTVTGKVKLRDGTSPATIDIRFASAGDVVEESPVRGETTCPVSSGVFRCRIPAGLLDLRIRSKGCIAHYEWNRAIEAGGTSTIGDLTLDRGASIVGSVALGRGLRTKFANVRVRAIAEGSEAQPTAMMTFAATPAAKGFFHLDGVPPGSYVVTAVAPQKLASAPVRVVVRGDAEVQLADPLVVDVPRTLTIDFTPPADPHQQPWIVMVKRAISERQLDVVSQNAAGADGHWSTRLQPGRYRIEVTSADDSSWDARTIDLDADDHLAIALASRAVRGVVTLGDKPLQAKLVFGGEFSSPSLAAHSSDEGRFEVNLPQRDKREWDVTVDADKPRVKRTLHVKLPADDDEVTIKLPLTLISGFVVDENGRRVDDVGINLAHAGGLMQTDVEKDGTFSLYALEPGLYQISADGYLKQSETVAITLPAEGVLDEVRLVVKPSRKVTGRVISDAGPVLGAEVLVAPSDVPATFSMYRRTDERGEFSTIVPPGCEQVDVLVAAPGFSFKAFHTALRDGVLTINVDQRGGTLTAHWPKSSETAILMHAGAVIYVDSLATSWSARRDSSKDAEELVAGPLDPGGYTLCVVSETNRAAARKRMASSRCVEGYLPPFGTLALDQ